MRIGFLPAAFNGAAEAAKGLLVGALVGSLVTTQPALAMTDGAAIGKCLIANCPANLARCVTNPTCAANLLCIQTCTNKPDESECQIKCGDEFSNDVVGAFTACAVSEKQCVPQRPDDNSWPVPRAEALAASFEPAKFTGTWYISAGLNPAFDTFDCQKHEFTSPAPNKLVGDLRWRIRDPVAGTNFVTRAALQEFVQDPQVPGIMYNHDNEFLHYQDDWFILAQRPDEYFLVYYRGSNDAWDGYGGAFVYSRESTLPTKYYAELDTALRRIGRQWSDFTLTDNTCAPRESKLEELEKDVQFVEARVATGLQMVGTEVVKDVVGLEKEVVKDVVGLEKEVVKDVVGLEKEVVKDVTAAEMEVVKDLKRLLGL